MFILLGGGEEGFLFSSLINLFKYLLSIWYVEVGDLGVGDIDEKRNINFYVYGIFILKERKKINRVSE